MLVSGAATSTDENLRTQVVLIIFSVKYIQLLIDPNNPVLSNILRSKSI